MCWKGYALPTELIVHTGLHIRKLVFNSILRAPTMNIIFCISREKNFIFSYIDIDAQFVESEHRAQSNTTCYIYLSHLVFIRFTFICLVPVSYPRIKLWVHVSSRHLLGIFIRYYIFCSLCNPHSYSCLYMTIWNYNSSIRLSAVVTGMGKI